MTDAIYIRRGKQLCTLDQRSPRETRIYLLPSIREIHLSRFLTLYLPNQVVFLTLIKINKSICVCNILQNIYVKLFFNLLKNISAEECSRFSTTRTSILMIVSFNISH